MRWFTNLNTRSKLAFAFGIVITFFAGVIVIALLWIPSAQRDVRYVADLMHYQSDLNGQRAAMTEAAMVSAGKPQDTALTELNGYANSTSKTLERLQAEFRDDAQREGLISEIAKLNAEFSRLRDQEAVPLIRQQKADEARTLITGSLEETYHKLRAMVGDFTTASSKLAETRLLQSEWSIGILGASALLASFGMVLGLSRMLAEPLAHLTSAAQRIAEGDLSAEVVESTRTDEIGILEKNFRRMTHSLKEVAERVGQIAAGDLTVEVKPQSEKDQLGNAFAAMSENLRRMVRELVGAVNVLAASAAEILAATTQMASSAAETASAVSETTTTIEEVKQTSQVSSQKARCVSDEAQKAADVAKVGRASVEQTMKGIEGIQRQMTSIAESIVNLSAQSQAIGEIITSVDDLAAQSKLLAVNASIEAAKAGEEGRGFSVVAQEVKSLAEQSKQATAQVRAILNDIQKATGQAVQATEQGGKTVEAGVEQSVRTGESIGALTENISQAAYAATQIAATSQEQFVGMDQVAIAMESIKNASTQTVASTRQTEAAAKQLHDLGQNLKRLLDRFQV